MNRIDIRCPKCGKPLGYVEGSYICFEPYWECGAMSDYIYSGIISEINRVVKGRGGMIVEGAKCKQCGNILAEEDWNNSLYATHYRLCKECASKISV